MTTAVAVVVFRMSMESGGSPALSCQLETRHWVITDEDGQEEYVDGPGVVGWLSSLRIVGVVG